MFENIRTRWRLDRLIRDWREYRDLVAGARGAEATATQEEGFRELEARLAARLQSIQDVPEYAAAPDARREFAAMTALLKRQRCLQDAAAEESADPESFASAWHGHFIFLNQLKGVALAPRRGGRHRQRRTAAALPGDGFRRPRPHALLLRRLAVWAVVLVVLAVVGHLVVNVMGLRYDTGVHRFVAAGQGGAAEFLQNLLNAGLGVIGDLVGFFAPVMAAYGLVWTLVFFVVLGFSLVYWVLVRG